MKAFLFLYPTIEFIWLELNLWFNYDPEPKKHLQRLNEIINIRYRQNDYQIYWLLFAQTPNSFLPDITRISEGIDVQTTDMIISAGITFEQLCRGSFANPEFVFSQIPDNLSELKVGGFHQDDCVDKMAEAAYRKGMPTLIDEDTTQRYFREIGLGRQIPDFREFTLSGFGYDDLRNSSPMLYSELVKRRRRKPWFAQEKLPSAVLA